MIVFPIKSPNTIALVLLLGALLFARSGLAEIHEYQLDNGLQILIKEDHRAPVVVSQIWYKVGGSYEPSGLTGVSHALEHMMFKGTQRYPGGAFSEIIAQYGGQDNAFTGIDYTAYFQVLGHEYLEFSFELEADRMRSLVFSEEEFAKEIEVVKEERRWRTEDNPQSFTYESAMATAFQTSPYRNPIVGWMADLEQMDIDDLEHWYRQWYTPSNALLVVVGDVDPDEVYQLAHEHFANIPDTKISSPSYASEPIQQGLKQLKVKRPAELAYLMMLYKVPSVTSSEIESWEPYALEVLARILDGGSASRFSSRLIRGTEVATATDISYRMISRLPETIFIISAVPTQKKGSQYLELGIRKEIFDIKYGEIDDAELARVKAQVISSEVYQQDSMFYQAMRIGLLESSGIESSQFIDDYVEQIKAVTASQLKQVAQKYLNDDFLTIARLEPLPLDESDLLGKKK